MESIILISIFVCFMLQLVFCYTLISGFAYSYKELTNEINSLRQEVKKISTFDNKFQKVLDQIE
jgi:hypothetical protein